MKSLTLITILLSVSTIAASDTSVKGYIRNDGTYVAPHMRSTPDSSTFNNYSSQGNTNPYNGREGTLAPSYGSPSRQAHILTPPAGSNSYDYYRTR